jgi:cobalt-zinc-cadmium efflux system outer membrane protein
MLLSKKYFFQIFFIFVITKSSFIFASPLDLQDVIRSAQEHHPSIKASSTEVEAATAELQSAEGGFDPTLKVATSDYITGNYTGGYLDASIEQPTSLYGTKFIAGYRKSGGDFPVYYAEQETQNDGEVRAGVEVPVLRDGEVDRRRTNLERAKIQSTIGNASLLQRRIEITRGAKSTFYDWIAAGKKLSIQKEYLSVTKKRQQQLSQRQVKGDLAQFDVIDNERTVLQRNALVIQAERILQQASYELSLFYRSDLGQPMIPSQEIIPSDLIVPSIKPIIDFDEQLHKAYLSRPDLIRLKQQKEQNTLELRLADNQLLPRLDLQVAAAQDFGVMEENRDEFELRGGVKFEVPLFNRVAIGRKKTLEAKDKELTFLISFLQDRIKADLKDVISALNQNRERILMSSKEYTIAQEVESGERERFFHGDSNLIFVNLREQTTADAAIRVVDAKLDFLKAQASFDAILGKDY